MKSEKKPCPKTFNIQIGNARTSLTIEYKNLLTISVRLNIVNKIPPTRWQFQRFGPIDDFWELIRHWLSSANNFPNWLLSVIKPLSRHVSESKSSFQIVIHAKFHWSVKKSITNYNRTNLININHPCTILLLRFLATPTSNSNHLDFDFRLSIVRVIIIKPPHVTSAIAIRRSTCHYLMTSLEQHGR